MSLPNERRRRFQRPKRITVIGFFLMIEPFLQIVGVSMYKDVSVAALLQEQFPVWLFFVFVPVISGYGLLHIQKWAWYLFAFYSIFLTVFNSYALILQQTGYNYFALVETFLSFIIIFYLIQDDISAPYFKMYPRGFRGQMRRPIRSNVEINGIHKITKDRSETGFYVDWENADLELNEEVEVFFPDDETPLIRKAGVVRIDEAGVGIAFRNR
ncbi:MAG: PilZ domain-containing protein [Spirochaetota bacterium]